MFAVRNQCASRLVPVGVCRRQEILPSSIVLRSRQLSRLVLVNSASSSGYLGAQDQQAGSLENQQGASLFERLRAWWIVESPKEVLPAGGLGENAASSTSSSSDMKPLLSRLGTLCAPDGLLMFCALFHMLVAAAAELMIP